MFIGAASRLDSTSITSFHHNLISLGNSLKHLERFRLHLFSEFFKKLGVRSLIITPLRSEGILIIGNNTLRKYSEEREINLLATLADQLATAIENVGIYEKERDAVARLTELDRIKNEFMSMVSHELRTPIVPIKGYATLMQASKLGEVSDKQKQGLDVILNNTEQLLVILDSLLDFAKIESGTFVVEKKLVSIHQIIETMLKTKQPFFAEKQVEVKTDLKAKNHKVMGDTQRLSEVLHNLLDNSIKFKGEESSLKIEVATRNVGNYVQVEIKDNGIGIESEQLERVFNKFYQVEPTMTRKVGGVGLGLAIIKEIIGKHQGKVWAESAGKGKGTKLIFTLPTAERS